MPLCGARYCLYGLGLMFRFREIFRSPPPGNLPVLAARIAERWYRPMISFLGSPSGSATYNLLLFALGAGKPAHPTNFMPQPSPTTPPHADGLGSRMRRRVQGGFTLVETMIATLVFCIGILGVYAMMLKSYELVTMSRHRDNGRALLTSFADEFLRLQTADKIAGTGVVRGLFVPHAATGMGLTWTDSTGATIDGNLHPAGLPVLLGDSGDPTKGSQVPAVVTREVTLIDTNGNPIPGTNPTLTAAGYLVQATFTIAYQIHGRQQNQSLIVARSAR